MKEVKGMKFLILNAASKPADEVNRYVCKDEDICVLRYYPGNGK